ncbi:MAG: ArsR family transcriptional regulator [Candidatus Woesearchaeota archaeon]
MPQHITLNNLRKPENDTASEIDWMCESLGLRRGRDTEHVTMRLVRHMLEKTSGKAPMSSDEMAKDLGIEVQRVNYHLRNLIDTGFFYREKRRIFLRDDSVKDTIEELRKDTNRMFDRLAEVGSHIDEALGIEEKK